MEVYGFLYMGVYVLGVPGPALGMPKASLQSPSYRKLFPKLARKCLQEDVKHKLGQQQDEER